MLIATIFPPICLAQQEAPAPAAETQSVAAPVRTDFHIRYVNGPNVYIDGGRNAGLAEGTKLVVKQDPTKQASDGENKAIEPGVIARLKVVSVASTSAVCVIDATSRDLQAGDVVTLPDSEVQNLVEKNALGSSRKYPMVVSFTGDDPLDEEVRNTIPRPALPEVNQFRGRIGFNVSNIQELGQGGASSNEYGAVVRIDYTRMFGSHWNLNGYWRGSLQSSSAPAQPTLQDTLNRTYLLSLSYINPGSHWTAGIGRLYLPWAASLETIDGAYFGRQTTKTVIGIFAGSTPDPTAWNYDPQRRIGGAFFNVHGGSFEKFHYSSTFGAGVELHGWATQRPFVFTENTISFRPYFSIFESAQVDRPTPNPSTPAVGTGLGQSLVSLRIQVHPRVILDLTDTYLRDVPTYDPVLLGTGLLDKYLFQGLSGGARVQFPQHLIGYFSLGQSSDSSDTKSSLNELFGVTDTSIWKTGVQADVRYSKFNSSFASGTYKTITISRDLGERFRLNLQGGQYAYTSSLAANSNSYFVNLLTDVNLGAKFFVEGAFTTQRGGSTNYNQITGTFGYRFNNRSKKRSLANVPHP